MSSKCNHQGLRARFTTDGKGITTNEAAVLKKLNHQGLRAGITADGKRITANEAAALKERGIIINVFCPICGESLTVVHYTNEKDECYFRCDDEHKYDYCKMLAQMKATTVRDENDLSWIFSDSLEPTKRVSKGTKPVVGPEEPNTTDGSDDIDLPTRDIDIDNPNFEDPGNSDDQGESNTPDHPVSQTVSQVSNLKQLYYSDDYYASDPLKPLPPSGKPIGEKIMLLNTNEQMIRALYNLPSALTPFTGGRFIVEGKIAREQSQLDQKRLDFQSTAVINHEATTVYIPCFFKKISDLMRIIKKCAVEKIAENGVNKYYVPTATVLIWGDFDVKKGNRYIRLIVKIKSGKQIFVTLPFSKCPDRSKE